MRGGGFSAATIVRPGLIGRGDLARGGERLATWLMPTVPASRVSWGELGWVGGWVWRKGGIRGWGLLGDVLGACAGEGV